MLKGGLSVCLALCFVFLSFSPVISGEMDQFCDDESDEVLSVEVSFFSNGSSCSEIVSLSSSELNLLRQHLDEFDFSFAVDVVESCGSLPVGFEKKAFVSELEQMSAKCSAFEASSCALNASTYVNSMCMLKYQTPYLLYSFLQLPIRLMLAFLGGIVSLIPLALIFLIFVSSGGFPPATIVDDFFDVFFLCLGVAAWGAFGPFYLSPIQLANSFLSLRLGWDDPAWLSTTGLSTSWDVYGVFDSVAIVGFTGAAVSVLNEDLQPFKEYELYGFAGLVYASGVIE